MIREATIRDLNDIWKLRLETTELLKERGIDQWQHQNPTFETFRKDIELHEFFVYEFNMEIIGMISIKKGVEKTYKVIFDGSWHNDLPYLTIHRLAVKREYLGKKIAEELLLFADHQAQLLNIKQIRIDTYYTNQNAIRLFEKHGYKYRGWILLEPGEGDLRRLAFDKWIGDKNEDMD